MSPVLISIKQIITMFLIIIMGIICYKVKIIDKKTNSALSAIVLNLVNPAMILISYQKEFDKALLVGLGWALLLSALSFALSIAVASLVIRRRPEKPWNIERIAIVFSNCGFMGIPLINALVGSIGVFYLAAYLTCFNLLLWTYGVMLMKKLSGAGEVIKNFISPCVISIFLGIIFFISGIHFPEPLYNAVDCIADMNTPLAMLAAGVTIARTSVFKAVKRLRVYFICLFKLAAVPVLTCILVFPFYKAGVDKDIIMTVVIAAACPTGASGTLFAIRFGGDDLYSSELFAVTTFLSALSIPLVMLLAGNLYA